MAQKDTMQSKQEPSGTDGRDVAAQREEPRETEAKDALCGLFSREAVVRHVEKRLSAMAETDSCALFLIDLDDFSRVNATLGCQAGIAPSAKRPGFYRVCSVLAMCLAAWAGMNSWPFWQGKFPKKRRVPRARRFAPNCSWFWARRQA